ncbi:hypothetical protein [Saccharothrix xinjiangensis]|uniref:Helix-turn-helix protein n=1 Tax=Saccharothrix xinjiangensis TaxID=204798 RepID=A0ABV9XTJ9_9PSEU
MSEIDERGQETLQQLFRRRQRELGEKVGEPDGLSVHAVWLRCNGQAGRETFRRIWEGTRTRITDSTVDALAMALDVPASEVLAAAGQRPRLGAFTPPRRWDQLTARERQVLLDVADALLDARSRQEEAAPVELHVAGTAPAASDRGRVKRAARRRPDPQS